MILRILAAVLVMTLTVEGCASTSPEQRAAAQGTRIVKNADAVNGCKRIGFITDDDLHELQRRAAQLGGDVVLVAASQAQTDQAAGRTYTTADVYRCGAGR